MSEQVNPIVGEGVAATNEQQLDTSKVRSIFPVPTPENQAAVASAMVEDRSDVLAAYQGVFDETYDRVMASTEVDPAFAYHSPSECGRVIMNSMRLHYSRTKRLIESLVPDSRDRARALSLLEDSNVALNKAINRTDHTARRIV